MRMPFLVALLWLAVAVSVLSEILRWWRLSRSVGDVLWAVDTNLPPMGFLMAAGAPSLGDKEFVSRLNPYVFGQPGAGIAGSAGTR
jgi:hypothetical protein